jgi:hypothetical protein
MVKITNHLIKINGENHKPPSEQNKVQGNFIGTDLSGVAALGNSIFGIYFGDNAFNNLIGGIVPEAGNVIAFNGAFGVACGGASNPGTGNVFLSNLIHSNGALGIDLNHGDGVTPNDPGDGDTGTNNLQNFPELQSAYSDETSIRVAGTINSTKETEFKLQFFFNNTCDPDGYGEGEKFLGETVLTTNGSGNQIFTEYLTANFPVTFPSCITATATGPDGTSEFGACEPLRMLIQPVVVEIIPGESAFFGRSIPHFMSSAGFHSSWPGSDVVMTLTTPSGRIINRSTTDPDVYHENGPTYENYLVSNPEAGRWTVQLFGSDIPPGGEDVTLIVSGEPTEPTMLINVDIKPGGHPNSINCLNENGLIPVAILTSPDFNALSLDHTKVSFGLTGVEATEHHVKKNGEPKRHEKDVDGDGNKDLVFHFRFGDTGLDCASQQSILMGETDEGLMVMGIDEVRMVGLFPKGEGLAGDGSISGIPGKYLLEEAYPNPFNPVTHIRYGLPNPSNVRIEVFDMLGRRISTLVEGQKPAGYHTVDFDGSNLSSGVYLYRLQAGDFVDVKKMVLMK